jgi:CheY-like chemotaxis protein
VKRTALVCEDDVLIRMNLVEMVEDLGFSVREAGDAETALATSENGPIDLLITDVRLGGVGGEELAQRLRQRDPGLPIVFATGDPSFAAFKGDPRVAVLGKPYTQEMLAGVVKRLLSDLPPASAHADAGG